MSGNDPDDALRQSFFRHLAPTSSEPIGLIVDHARGPWVTMTNGRKYIDLLSGIGVANIGHTHPQVVDAVQDQNRRHHHVMVYGEYIQEEQTRYAQELARVTPPGLDSVYFVNSGTEAVEGALKLARKATGRSGFVTFSGAYHGDTLGSLSVIGNDAYQDPFMPLLGPVTRAPFGDVSALAALNETVAAVIVEPVQGEGGVRIPPGDFLPALGARCRETGSLLILDEVMTGFGRTGKLFACEHWGVVPDVLVLAKALGGGYPLGAFVARRSLLQTLSVDPPLSHVTTFGGHPVSCAAGRAGLKVILEEGLVERSETMGLVFRKMLTDALFPGSGSGLREVRGLGLFVGLEFDTAERTRRFVEECREGGVLMGWTLHHDNIVRLLPPLNIGKDVLEEAVSVMASVLQRLS